MRAALDEYQDAIGQWVAEHFPNEDTKACVLALVEEVGEVARCVLKRDEHHRGTPEAWTAELRNELGDVLIVLLNLANLEGVSLADVLDERWVHVSTRDVAHDPIPSST